MNVIKCLNSILFQGNNFQFNVLFCNNISFCLWGQEDNKDNKVSTCIHLNIQIHARTICEQTIPCIRSILYNVYRTIMNVDTFAQNVVWLFTFCVLTRAFKKAKKCKQLTFRISSDLLLFGMHLLSICTLLQHQHETLRYRSSLEKSLFFRLQVGRTPTMLRLYIKTVLIINVSIFRV